MNWKTSLPKISITLALGSILFLFIAFYFISFRPSHFILVSGIFCFVSIGYLLSLGSLNYLFFILAFTLPFSIKINLFHSDLSVLFPSEPIVGVLAIALAFKFALQGFSAPKALKHPLTILVYIYLLASVFSLLLSDLKLVSGKAFIVRLSYVMVFYFGALSVFRTRPVFILQLSITYGLSLFLVTLYYLYSQSHFNWDKLTAAYSIQPFYADHTIFSASLAFILPYFIFNRSTASLPFSSSKLISWIFCLVFFLGLYFTFCRAAWLSIIISLAFLICINLRFRLIHYFILLFAALAFVVLFEDELLYKMKQTKEVSTAPNTSAIEQTQSIANISTDVSNAERLNRWSCAWRMFLEKPLTGFGVGTFQFQYLRFQLPDETTYISVYSPYNIPQGRGGSTHNEYLLLLSECGIIACIAFVFLLLGAIAIGISNIRKAKNSGTKALLLSVALSLFTYIVHGIFNNFLDTDKLAFLFWSSIAFLVLLDLEQKKAANLS
jgi:putative inorganic carbon (hco3(-)) transporter